MGFKSKASEKLQNIKAIQELLTGTHRTQTRKTFSASSTDNRSKKQKNQVDAKIHAVGDTWREDDGEGNITVVTKVGPNEYYRRSERFYEIEINPEEDKKFTKQQLGFPNCPKDICEITSPSKADRRCGARSGMCLNCQLEYESKLRYSGKYNEYANEKLKQNILSFIKDAESDVEELKNKIREGISYIGENGEVEKWSGEQQDIMIEKLENDWQIMKKGLLAKIGEGGSSE